MVVTQSMTTTVTRESSSRKPSVRRVASTPLLPGSRKSKSTKSLESKPPIFNLFTEPESGASDLSCRTWNGHARTSESWNGLRRDPELWFPQGNCLVHLYSREQSRRGPSFRVHMDKVLAASCRPLLYRCLHSNGASFPVSESGSSDDGYYSGNQSHNRTYDLYIPAPKFAERGQAFLYHTATRNFFAWLFGKSLVGAHLGGAIVDLLNTMNEFRSVALDNITATMDYLENQGYTDMRDSPDHALAVLFFAEQFQFRNLWINAFAHCTGMHQRLAFSPGFEFISAIARALITRARIELNTRLEFAGKQLGNFLSESDVHLGLSSVGLNHLDKFRTFLQSYYIGKLGYYPPAPEEASSSAFPKYVLVQMCSDFQNLYGYLVDFEYPSSSVLPPKTQQGGICVLQSLWAFDRRHKYPSLLHQLPLLPEIEYTSLTRTSTNRRITWYKQDSKLRPDARLITVSSMMKATNSSPDRDCDFVGAYRDFEKDCIIPVVPGEKAEKLSPTEGRKIRWILVYSILRILTSVTKTSLEVGDKENDSYKLCVLTAGILPWQEKKPIETHAEAYAEKVSKTFIPTLAKTAAVSKPPTSAEIQPDIDYLALKHSAGLERPPIPSRIPSVTILEPRKGSVPRARKSLISRKFPELRHAIPRRAHFHEIILDGYGNGTQQAIIPAEEPAAAAPAPDPAPIRQQVNVHARRISCASSVGVS
ncbi:hypothetical protein BJ878DRAFT_209134 [Calycina marina]|uniref:DUF8004 domain-containing protein n=1 Tax=Calycina marina TaxID=1763456 RepID=A0A9P8CHF2_9HELO|nr:hypothetical protein BJ878DRAFT_209134 [Calycina marina]